MLQIFNISKSFNEIKALDNVDLNINKGKFFGLLGPNGAGKTTLMNVIIGFLNPDEGKVTINNNLMTFENIKLRKKIGYIPQEISLYQELSAEQNLKIFGGFYNLSAKELAKNIDKALELVQLNERNKETVKNFSGGMKRRLNLAASILHDPDILLCDEPTVGVDPQSRNAIFNMLQELNADGKTILYTTHYMEEAERLCSRLAIIDYGKIIAEGTLSDLVNMLEQKETLKVQKTTFTRSKEKELQTLGQLTEQDFYYELIPSKDFNSIAKLFNKIDEIGIPDDTIELSRASLEDVFLTLTGRSLRD